MLSGFGGEVIFVMGGLRSLIVAISLHDVCSGEILMRMQCNFAKIALIEQIGS